MSKADRTTLLRVIEAIDTVSDAYRGFADESDLYEAMLFTLCVDAAKKAGGKLEYVWNSGERASALHFRRAPGNLWSPGFTYAKVRFDGRRRWLEIHLGVKAVGLSGVPHECDVAILQSSEAERCRRDEKPPRREGLVAAVEAKNYSSRPPLGVGRAFHGLAHELGERKCSLVYPSELSFGIADLIATRPSEQFEGLLPGKPTADLLRDHLVQAIEAWKK